jgi:hypothetical protein
MTRRRKRYQWWPDNKKHTFFLYVLYEHIQGCNMETNMKCIENLISQLEVDPVLLVKWKLLRDRKTILEILDAADGA